MPPVQLDEMTEETFSQWVKAARHLHRVASQFAQANSDRPECGALAEACENFQQLSESEEK